jgi:hypothetical protein
LKVLTVEPGVPEGFDISSDTGIVQFFKPLAQSEYETLATALLGRPDVCLRVYRQFGAEFRDLDFLSHFPHVRRLAIDLFELSNIEGLQAVTDLDEFSFGLTRKKNFSLQVLGRFRSIRRLHLEGQSKDIDVIADIPQLDNLTLRSITLVDVALLGEMSGLKRLAINLGGTRDLKPLSMLHDLERLELCMIRGLSDISFIEDLESLETLVLQALRNIDHLPSFQRLARLRSIHLETMKILSDLSAIGEAGSLESLALIDMRAVDPESLKVLIGHPKLRKFTAGLGSFKRNAYAYALLGLPSTGWVPDALRERVEQGMVIQAAERLIRP